MATITLDIPDSQIRQLLETFWNAGLSGSVRVPSRLNRKKRTAQTVSVPYQFKSEPFLLFDWEFFSNELEYE